LLDSKLSAKDAQTSEDTVMRTLTVFVPQFASGMFKIANGCNPGWRERCGSEIDRSACSKGCLTRQVEGLIRTIDNRPGEPRPASRKRSM
jgi:hypothetical protein